MTPQQSIAHYRIISKLGEGGMGTVYRATDTKLNREVALKILPDALANDPEYLARFTREAQVLAVLNHPHIAAVYGIEERAIVMELVEGRELPTPLPMEEALPVARQIAEALEAAHERGIVHRDLKPANIKLTADGNVKVLDFGLAKSVERAGANAASATVSPTLTLGATQVGMIMGTAAYMAPEQAAGKPVDKRADIWAFGVVLYEMLAGGRLFDGESLAHTLADVLRKEIDLGQLPAATPPAVRDLLARCLDRDPRTRLRDIGEARVLLSGRLSGPPAPAALPPAAAPGRSLLPWLVAAAIALLAIGEFAWQRFHPAAPSARTVRFTIPFPEGAEEIPTRSGRTFVPSPDGRSIAFAAVDTHDHQQHLYVRPIDSVTARRFDKTEGANFPFWSPDSQAVGFFAEQALRRATLSTGAVQTICDFSGEIVNRSGNGAAWGPDGVVLFGIRGALLRVAASGGTPEAATELDAGAGEFSHAWPQFLPDGKHFLYLARAGATERQAIYAGELGSKRRTLVLRTETPVAFVPPGALLFLRGSALMVQRFDPQSLQLAGEPASLGADVSANAINGRAAFAVSENGVLVFRESGDELTMQLSWYDRTGKRLAAITKPGVYFGVKLAPDGKSATLMTIPKGPRGFSEYMAMLDLATGVIAPAGSETTRWNEWAPDSKHLFYSSRGAGHVFELALDTGAVAEITADRPLPMLAAVSPDSRLLLLHDDIKSQTFLLPLAAPRKLQLVMDAPFRRSTFRISPDGTKVAWIGTEAAESEIFVAGFPSFTGKRQVSAEGGADPQWSRDGRELYYLHDSTLMAVAVQPGDAIRAGIPKPLFSFQPSSNITATYAPADGRFLVSELIGAPRTPPVMVVLNWQAELKK